MIYLRVGEENFEYDLRGLLMAFYPGTLISTKVPADEDIGADDMLLSVEYAENEARSYLRRGDKLLYSERAAVDRADRSSGKSAVKRLVYGILSKDTGKSLPWGTLTGIRPTKIAMSMLEEGRTDEEIYSCMTGTYLTGSKKVNLSTEIAKRERELLKDIDYRDGYSIYIGIPFCPTTCLYCSFTSYPVKKWEPRMDEYVNALFKELEFTKRAFADKKLNTIYIGGGTPTTLSPGQIDRLLSGIEESFDLTYLKEWTFEAGRPDSITREKLTVLKDHSVTRISINPQTMNEKTLRIIGRYHTPEQIREAYFMARDVGMDNINMDIIMGLPEEGIDDVRYTMGELEKLAPDSITVHSLAVKRAARLNTMRDEYAGLKFENTDEIMDLTEASCRRMGLLPYYLYRQKNMAGNFENVGYAAKGKAGIYNILMMEEKQSIAAVGAGSTSKAVFSDGRIERCDNVKDIEQYLERTDEMTERKEKLFLEKKRADVVS